MRPSTAPSEWAVVASLSWRAVASLAAGSTIRATIMARISLARRSGPCGRILSSPSRRTVPSAAATWPCASARAISKRSAATGARVSPASTRRRLSILASGQSEMLARVRLDLAVLAIALAQQDGGRRIAVRDARDVHEKLESWPLDRVKRDLHAYNFHCKSPKPA